MNTLLSQCNQTYKDTLSTESKQSLPTHKADKNNALWFRDPTILFTENNYLRFVPHRFMTNHQILNAIMRFGLYIGILLCILYNSSRFVLIPVIVGIFTYVIGSNSKEDFVNAVDNILSEHHTMPTENNPFMNTLLPEVGDGPRKPAVNLQEFPHLQKEIEWLYNKDLCKDPDDIYNKRNSQNRFYTVPSTQEYGVLHGDTVKFANWLYNDGKPTCKENSKSCIDGLSKFSTYQHLKSHNLTDPHTQLHSPISSCFR